MKEHTELIINGLTLRGYYEHPQKEGFPLLIMFHGFTGDCTESGFIFSRISKILSENGTGTLRFSFPGSGESDGEFRDTSTLIWARYIRLIYEYAKTLKGPDKDRIYSLGMSLGGASLIRSGIDTDLMILLAPAIGYAGKYERVSFKGNLTVGECLFEDEKDTDYEKMLKETKGRVVFIHSEDDKTIPYEVSEVYSRYPKDSVLHTIGSGGHTFDDVEGFESLVRMIRDEIEKKE